MRLITLTCPGCEYLIELGQTPTQAKAAHDLLARVGVLQHTSHQDETRCCHRRRPHRRRDLINYLAKR